MKRTNAGLTLVELMVTLAVFAVLVVIAVPAYNNVININRTAEGINALSRDLSMARSEALARNANVTICASANATTATPPTCSGSNTWETGWIVFVDFNRDGVVDTSDVLLRATGPIPSGYTLRAHVGFDDNTRLQFRPTGELRDTTGDGINRGTFRLRDNNTDSAQNRRIRAINVSPLGRVSLAVDSNNNGIVEDINGNDITS